LAAQSTKLGRKARKMLTIHRQHYRSADTDRLYGPRKERRRGMMQTEGAYTGEVTKLMEYVERKEDSLIHIVRTHQYPTNST
jgi:hypothetical protein